MVEAETVLDTPSVAVAQLAPEKAAAPTNLDEIGAMRENIIAEFERPNSNIPFSALP